VLCFGRPKHLCRNFSFNPWSDMVPRFKYDPSTPFFQLLVPTVDTTRYAFLLQTCLRVSQRSCVQSTCVSLMDCSIRLAHIMCCSRRQGVVCCSQAPAVLGRRLLSRTPCHAWLQLRA
jgi:hypothetical protein